MKRRDQAKRGVALILVLGMLALLLLLAVAFAVTMRVERAGAGNSQYNVFSRNLTWVALARAQQDIDATLSRAASGLDVYPTNAPAWGSIPTAGESIRLAWGEALHHIPGDLTNAAAAVPCGWVDTREEGGLRGRYAYLIVNASGLLDANEVCGMTRAGGRHPQEIDISGLWDVRSTNDFVRCRRDPDKRYEMLDEFYELQKGAGLYPAPPVREPSWPTGWPGHFMTYSRFPMGRLERVGGGGWTTLTNICYIGDDVSRLEALPATDPVRMAALVAGLVGSGIPATETGFVYSNLLDYLDADDVPRNLGSPLTESVPMVNELYCQSTVRTNSFRFEPRVEWFYPFVKRSTDSFNVYCSLTAKVENVSAPGSVMSLGMAATTPAGYSSGTEVHGVVRYRPMTSPAGGFSCRPGDVLRLSVTAKLRVLNAGGAVVDSVPYPWDGAPLCATNLFAVPAGGFVTNALDIECVDPRFNWSTTASDNMWRASAAETLGKTNAATAAYLSRGLAIDPAIDRGADMYVSDGRRLQSVGELGHLLRAVKDGAAYGFFKTIRVYDHRGIGARPRVATRDRVLDYFTVTNGIAHGLVNVNTQHTNVLDAVFRRTPIGYPASTNRLTVAEADAIVSKIVDLTVTNPCENVSEIAAFDWRAMMPSRTDLKIESVIAHNCGLLHTRQNLFLIFLAAGPWSRGVGVVRETLLIGDWLGTHRAVALVWRDPFPDADGKHPVKLCWFKWLTED